MRTPLRLLSIILATTLIVALGACSKKKKEEGGPESSAPISESDLGGGADSDSGKAMGLETVHYAYDSATLDPGAKSTLKANSQILKDKTSLKVQIEGHCDERGGIQYNIALGERRANAAKAFLVDKGVDAERVTIISYGKEKPIDQGHDDSAWAKNRRANFRVTDK